MADQHISANLDALCPYGHTDGHSDTAKHVNTYTGPNAYARLSAGLCRDCGQSLSIYYVGSSVGGNYEALRLWHPIYIQ